MVTGINDAGNTFFDVAGNGKLSCARIHKVLEKLTLSGTFVTTNREKSYVSVLKGLNVGPHSAYDDHEYGHLSRIDSYPSRFRNFLYRFKGVSSRWLKQFSDGRNRPRCSWKHCRIVSSSKGSCADITA